MRPLTSENTELRRCYTYNLSNDDKECIALVPKFKMTQEELYYYPGYLTRYYFPEGTFTSPCGQAELNSFWKQVMLQEARNRYN